jgi:isoquinoline 1-oxidoreductase beta subunit
MEYVAQPCALPVGWWRSVEDSLNAFAVESFIDELARAAGQDPLQYRLALLTPRGRMPSADGAAIEIDRLRRVLLAVGTQCAWPSAAPPGRARGVACHACRGSYIAVVFEVSAVGTAPAVVRIWAAVDCGTVVNPLGLEAQIEGGLIFGTSAALYEAITLEQGAIQQTNFDSYPVLRLDACPRIDVLILPSEAPPGGAGEIAVPVAAPAIANAWHALSGRRLRRLPLRSR